MKTQFVDFGSIELSVPSDIAESYGPGAWDENAEHYGPIVRRLNPYVDWHSLVHEFVNEWGIDDREWDQEMAWQYAAWIVAGDLYEEGRAK